MNIKKGKTRSVGVNPLKAACSNGVYTYPHEPGLFTRIMPAIVMPLKMSRASNRCICCHVCQINKLVNSDKDSILLAIKKQICEKYFYIVNILISLKNMFIPFLLLFLSKKNFYTPFI